MQRGKDRRRYRHEKFEEEQEVPAEESSGGDSELPSKTEDILDEIEDILKEIESPEEWVRNFVQRGGQ